MKKKGFNNDAMYFRLTEEPQTQMLNKKKKKEEEMHYLYSWKGQKRKHNMDT